MLLEVSFVDEDCLIIEETGVAVDDSGFFVELDGVEVDNDTNDATADKGVFAGDFDFGDLLTPRIGEISADNKYYSNK